RARAGAGRPGPRGSRRPRRAGPERPGSRPRRRRPGPRTRPSGSCGTAGRARGPRGPRRGPGRARRRARRRRYAPAVGPPPRAARAAPRRPRGARRRSRVLSRPCLVLSSARRAPPAPTGHPEERVARRPSGRAEAQPPTTAVRGPRTKYTTNPAATTHRSGWTSRARPHAVRSRTHVTNPIPMPFAIEYVSGIVTTVRNTGSATVKSPRSISLISRIIIAPTTTRTALATSIGTTAVSGVRNIATRNRPPVTTDARPVRAPSPTPAAESTNTVFDDDDVAPPTTAPTPS